MRNSRKRQSTFNIWTLIIGLLIAVALLAGFWAAVIFLRQPEAAAGKSDLAITVVAAPTLTPVISMPPPVATTTPTQAPAQNGIPPSNGSIAVGMYVQITGTGGVGLKIRDQPGTSSKQLFLGMESEVYLVQDGPKQKDGYTWFYLVAPYDKNRSGWAASNYLSIIQKPSG